MNISTTLANSGTDSRCNSAGHHPRARRPYVSSSSALVLLASCSHLNGNLRNIPHQSGPEASVKPCYSLGLDDHLTRLEHCKHKGQAQYTSGRSPLVSERPTIRTALASLRDLSQVLCIHVLLAAPSPCKKVNLWCHAFLFFYFSHIAAWNKLLYAPFLCM